MFSRRLFMGGAAGISVAAAAPAWSQDTCAVFTKARQSATSPDDALERLKDGNDRFVAGKSVRCNLTVQVMKTAAAQAPFATVIGCIDSRVPPELIFDQHFGDLFVVRIAGNFVNTDIIGSLEFATKLAGSKLIVVLGHSHCGAIKGAIDDVKLGNLTSMLKNFAPALEATKAIPGPRSSKNEELLQATAVANVRIAAAQIISRSEVLGELVDKKQLKIVGAMSDLETGEVEFIS